MEILVCIKQVPDDSVEINFDPEKNGPALDGVTPVVNAFDTYALEMAARFKEAEGGEITVVSSGDDSVKNSLKNCLAVGADKAYLVPNDNADALDAAGIAQCLIQAKEAIEAKEDKKFDVIFFGKESTDYASSQVGLILAEKLGIPAAANVVGVEKAEAGLAIKQETDEGYNLLEAAMPCAVTVQKPNYDPRYPTIKSKMAARKKTIETIEAADCPESRIEVLKVYGPAKRQAGVKIQAESAEEAVAQAMAMMTEAKVF